jgi:hypothetical protein
MKTTGNGSTKAGWLRRAVFGTALAAVGLLTLGTASKPAEAYWYHPYYYWHPHHVHVYVYTPYGGYAPVYYYGGWGWHRWHHWHYWHHYW